MGSDWVSSFKRNALSLGLIICVVALFVGVMLLLIKSSVPDVDKIKLMKRYYPSQSDQEILQTYNTQLQQIEKGAHDAYNSAYMINIFASTSRRIAMANIAKTSYYNKLTGIDKDIHTQQQQALRPYRTTGILVIFIGAIGSLSIGAVYAFSGNQNNQRRR